MKKLWLFLGALCTLGVALGVWARGGKCTSCQKEMPFFQVFSKPTSDLAARERKFFNFAHQSYPFFRVAVTGEEALFPDVQATLQKFPHRFVRLPGGVSVGESFYRWIHTIPSTDIVVLSPAKETLELSALERMKTVFKGSAAWLGFQGDVRKWAENGVLSGYASLFQQIKLQEFLEDGRFSDHKTAEGRLFELAGRHVRRLRGPFVEGKKYGHQWIARSKHPYPKYRPSFGKTSDQTADLVIFSFDRPLQLFALLESTGAWVSSLGNISVIYRVSSSDFEEGYEVVKRQFPKVQYLKQGDHPEKDFKPLLLKATFEGGSNHVLFAVDDMIVRGPIDLALGIKQMEKTGALGVYYRLGKHIDFCYMLNQEEPIPPSVPLGDQAWAWQFSSGIGDWKYPHTVDMTLYRKKDLKKLLTSLSYTHPNSLESKWALKAKIAGVGIYYDTSKVVNIPLNLVNLSDNRHAGRHSPKELLELFLQGQKIDIAPLASLENRSPHVDVPVHFITREDAIR